MKFFWLTTKLSNIKRVTLFGLALLSIGIAIFFTPPGAAASITNYVASSFGIDRFFIGGLITLSGVLMLAFPSQLGLYILCTVPWGLYCLSAFFFEATNHLSATAGVAYSFLYLLMLFEAFDLP